MRTSHAVCAVTAALLIGFFSGRAAPAKTTEQGRELAKASDGDRPTRLKTRSSERGASGVSDNSQGGRLRQEIRTAAPKDLASILFRSLEVPDPILRRQLVLELYARMDASNFAEMVDSVARVSLETGRENNDEWLVANTRAGQVGGAAAMEKWNKPGLRTTDQGRQTMWGWASVDPDAAKRWLDAATDLSPGERAALLGCVTSGAVNCDPERAKKMLADLPEQERMSCVTPFIRHLVQNTGKEGAMDWLKSVVSSENGTAYSRRVSEQVFDKLIWSGANQHNAVSMTGDLERISSVVSIDENWIVRSMGQIRDRKPVGGIELLDQISRNPSLKDIPLGNRAWNSAVRYAMEKDRGAVASWIEANPTSPIYGRVVEMFEGPGPQ